jgi:hypothetical protein
MIRDADLVGYWKITKMEIWDQAYVDLVVPGFIEFELEDGYLLGQFQFGTVVGWLDCRLRGVGGESYIEWSWEGHNDSDPGCGRGWAHLVDSKLMGRIYIHCSDDSAFEAEKRQRPTKRRRNKRPPQKVLVDARPGDHHN